MNVNICNILVHKTINPTKNGDIQMHLNVCKGNAKSFHNLKYIFHGDESVI